MVDVVVLAMLVEFVTAITIVRGISSTFQHKSVATVASSFHLAATTLSNPVSISLCDHGLHFEITAQKMPSTSEASSNLNTDACGFVHLADDGVLHSYAANSSVIDYVPLNQVQIEAFLARVSPSKLNTTYLRVMLGVDGYNVTNATWL